MSERWMNDLRDSLNQRSFGFSEIDEPKGGISLEVADEDCLVEIHPDRSLVCLFGLDLDELRGMISGSATEDLSGDELQRVARDNLRRIIGARAMVLRRSGYVEEIQATEEYYVLCYRKVLEEQEGEKILESIRQCLKIIEGKK